eukprot:9466566-Pyramimonas_sp.AAC.1
MFVDWLVSRVEPIFQDQVRAWKADSRTDCQTDSQTVASTQSSPRANRTGGEDANPEFGEGQLVMAAAACVTKSGVSGVGGRGAAPPRFDPKHR